jgi:hypothetical protein
MKQKRVTTSLLLTTTFIVHLFKNVAWTYIHVVLQLNSNLIRHNQIWILVQSVIFHTDCFSIRELWYQPLLLFSSLPLFRSRALIAMLVRTPDTTVMQVVTQCATGRHHPRARCMAATCRWLGQTRKGQWTGCWILSARGSARVH